MKKVVSALTAAAMCASMAAGVVSVFAYTTDEIGFYLAVTSEDAGYTVSEDGKTITFASAADAAGATFTVGQFISADASKPAIQQIGGMVEGSSPMIHLGKETADGFVGVDAADTVAYYDAAQSYTLADGTTFSTNAYVNCFGYVNKLKKYKGGIMQMSWGHSSTWPEKWGYTSENERLNWIYANDLSNPNYDDKNTAYFLGGQSDLFPLVGFDVTLDAAITDGTYTIKWVETYTNDYSDSAAATFVNSGDSVLMPVGTLESLTIVVGDATDPQPTEPSDEPTEPSDEPTEPSQDPSDDNNNTDVFEGHTWYVKDAVTDADRIAYIDVCVQNDPGTLGYAFGLLMEGKTFAEWDIEIADIYAGDAYTITGDFAPNYAEGSVAFACTSTTTPEKGKDGGAVVTFAVIVPESVEDGVYDITFTDVSQATSSADIGMLTPKFVGGTLTVGNPEPTEPSDEPTEPSDEPTEPSDEPTEPSDEPTTPSQPGDYLYGDVNKNGEVQLVDIVMLNRYLTGYGDQKLDDYQTEVADCWDDAELDGKDSIEILKYLIGLNKSLPTAAK